MKKRLEIIEATNLTDFNQLINVFLVKLGHYKIIDIQYLQKETENQYLAFIIYQI